jgi:hypothetical protein
VDEGKWLTMVAEGKRYRFKSSGVVWRVEGMNERGGVHLRHEHTDVPHHASGADWTVLVRELKDTSLFEEVPS